VKQASRFLNGLSGGRVLVVGDLMLDEYLWGHVERISPEAPVPVLNLIRRESMLGGAGNVVRNLRSLGANATVVGAVGDDGTGERLVELLDALGADASGVVRDPHRTSTRKTRLVSLEHGQQVFRLDEESAQAVYGEVEDRLVRAIHEKVEGAQAIVCSDYLKGALTERVLQAAFAAARERGIPAIVAPKDKKPAKYAGASILIPNVKELGELAGTRPDGSDWLTDSARRLTEALGLQALVVTRGGDGMSLFEPGRAGLRRVDIPTVAQSVYDVTGAGDTALAAFAAAVASGADYEAAARLANVAAGIVVGKRGTATVTVEEIRDHANEKSSRVPQSQKSLSVPPLSLEQ
jgi:D-beta-D-heptose 7-phosphate kinase / D-beta-D-heptose 1-phosphate adenosyltransferase